MIVGCYRRPKPHTTAGPKGYFLDGYLDFHEFLSNSNKKFPPVRLKTTKTGNKQYIETTKTHEYCKYFKRRLLEKYWKNNLETLFFVFYRGKTASQEYSVNFKNPLLVNYCELIFNFIDLSVFRCKTRI